MLLTGSGTVKSAIDLLTVLIIFAFVLGLTWFVTRWIANYEKGRSFGKNVEVMEAFRIAPNKYVQIIRIGKKYVAVAVSKDAVTMLTEIPEEQLQLPEAAAEKTQKSFREILASYRQKQMQEKK